MYQYTHSRMQFFAAIFISTIAFVFLIAPPAEARTIPDILAERVCPRLEAAFARLPVPVSLPSFCTPTPPPPTTATLTLVKTVTNNNGGTATAANFQAKIDGNNTAWSAAQTLTPGAYTASETGVGGYTASAWGGDCGADGTITLVAGENKTCTITNDDQPGTLIVKKIVTNDNGGTADAEDFTFQVNTGTAVAFEADGQNDLTVDAGTYTVTEPAAAGYTTTYDNCTDVVVSNGEIETCTITNNDVAPAPAPTMATLTLVKEVIKDNGGTALATDWTLVGDGPTDISGVSGNAAVTNAPVLPGEYALAETGGPTGYTASQFSCVKNAGAPVIVNAITLAAGDTAVCTITNDDQSGILLIKKIVIRDNGGDAATTTFSFQVDGGTAEFFDVDGENSVPVNAGTYDVTEVAVAGYTTTYENCTDVAVANGETETCTIWNDDNPTLPTANYVLISEVYDDPDTAHTLPLGSVQNYEWVELHNPTDTAVNVSGWFIADATGSDALPDGTEIVAGGYLLIFATSTTEALWTNIPDGVPTVVLGGLIGSNGLGNDGDDVFLRNVALLEIDAVSYGPEDGEVPNVGDGHSIARNPVAVDSDSPDDWEDEDVPTPGF